MTLTHGGDTAAQHGDASRHFGRWCVAVVSSLLLMLVTMLLCSHIYRFVLPNSSLPQLGSSVLLTTSLPQLGSSALLTTSLPQLDGFVDLCRDHTFIHIPKNGGSSIEEECPNTNSILRRVRCLCRRCNKAVSDCVHRRFRPTPPHFLHGANKRVWLSPWHVPAELYRDIYGEDFSRRHQPTFCIVRRPSERYASCVAWSSKFARWKANASRLLFRYQRPAMWSDELLHRMPQYMFVWSSSGAVQCDCIVAFEKLARITKFHKNIRPRNKSLKKMPRDFINLYRADHALWLRARQSDELCYSPPPRRELPADWPPMPWLWQKLQPSKDTLRNNDPGRFDWVAAAVNSRGDRGYKGDK